MLTIGFMKTTAIKKACELVGGAAKLAVLADVSLTAVYQWLAGDRPVPAERAPLIERATNGKVRADELCPKVPWDIVRNGPTIPMDAP